MKITFNKDDEYPFDHNPVSRSITQLGSQYLKTQGNNIKTVMNKASFVFWDATEMLNEEKKKNTLLPEYAKKKYIRINLLVAVCSLDVTAHNLQLY